MNIAINGFGRIGRQALKAGWGKRNLNFVAINDLGDIENLAYLLKYDSVYGTWDHKVSVKGNNIVIGKKPIKVLCESNPRKLPWRKLKIDVVIESTGVFTKEEDLKKHIKAGSKRAVLSAPAKGGNVPTHVIGVNDAAYDGADYINNASCTTNCVAPVAQVIHSSFGVLKASMTTIHGYTSGQSLIDGPVPLRKKDFRRGRAAGVNIVPTSTGAAIATTQTIPELEGLFDGIAMRVPVPSGSISDFTFLTKKKTTAEKVNSAFKKAAKHPLYKGVIQVTQDQLVSTDILGTTASAIVDLSFTRVIDHDLVKVLAWYDNEWAYAHRLIEMVETVGKTI